MQALIDSGIIPKQLTHFGGGDVFSLSGAVALGYVHPISIILVSVFAIGFTTSAIAGERQRGTLEVLLARPLSRRQVYGTLLVAALVFIGLVPAAAIDRDADRLGDRGRPRRAARGTPAAPLAQRRPAVGRDRGDRARRVRVVRSLDPALGITMAIVVVCYFLEILGSLWPDAAGLQPYSLFHYLAARDILNGDVARRRARAAGGGRRGRDRLGADHLPATGSRGAELNCRPAATPEGRAFPPAEDRTCRNWTSSTQGAAMWAISTAKACAMMPRHDHGTHRIPRVGPRAVAVKATCAAPAGTGCSTASPRSKAVFASLTTVAGPCGTGHISRVF